MQANLSLCGSHIPHCWKSHVATPIISVLDSCLIIIYVVSYAHVHFVCIIVFVCVCVKECHLVDLLHYIWRYRVNKIKKNAKPTRTAHSMP